MKLSRGCLAVQIALASGLSLITASNALQASGFAVPEISLAGLAMSNALVANPDEVGAIPYNPSAMSFHDHHNLSGGLMLFFPTLETSTASGKHESEGEDTVLIPNLQATFKATDKISLGLGASAPFGLETFWPVGTFPQLSQPIGPLPGGGSLPPGIFHPTQSKLEMFAITPTLAYKVNENFSIAGGLDYYNAQKVLFNTGLVKIRGDGDNWGWNVSTMFRSGPLSLGASYHSAVTVGLDGSFDALGSPSIPVDADLNLPSRFQLGVRYAFTERLAAEIDWTRTGWSDFDVLLVTAKADGTVLTRSENNWDDADAYRLGVSYDVTSNTQLRFGYTYNETGQDSEFFSARIPDADRNLFSIGVAHKMDGGWELEGGYMYVKFDDNDYQGNRPFNPLEPDSNGTSAIDGKYESHVHILGIGVSKNFM